jgi:hypothetical protein
MRIRILTLESTVEDELKANIHLPEGIGNCLLGFIKSITTALNMWNSPHYPGQGQCYVRRLL